ncbi:MAG: cytochrome c [Hyphomicrobium sp.]
MLLVLIVLAIGLLIVGGRALSQGAPPSPPGDSRGFDYWQPDWMVRELWGPGRMPRSMMVRLLRHTTYMQYGVPTEYAGALSNTGKEPGAIAAGRKLYEANCTRCHGAKGLGAGGAGEAGAVGDGGLALSPSPALLSYMIKRPVSVDEYLIWSISDGGKQFDSEMPAFKAALSRDEIWRVIAFMRAGFPGEESKPAKK